MTLEDYLMALNSTAEVLVVQNIQVNMPKPCWLVDPQKFMTDEDYVPGELLMAHVAGIHNEYTPTRVVVDL